MLTLLTPSGKRRVFSHYFLVEVDVQVSPLVSIDTWRGGFLFYWEVMGFLTLQVVSTDAAVCVCLCVYVWGEEGRKGEEEMASFLSGNNEHFDFSNLPLTPQQRESWAILLLPSEDSSPGSPCGLCWDHSTGSIEASVTYLWGWKSVLSWACANMSGLGPWFLLYFSAMQWWFSKTTFFFFISLGWPFLRMLFFQSQS